MIKDQIIEDLKEVLSQLGLSTEQVKVERPTISGFGDYTSNIALQLKGNYQKPIEIAKNIESKFTRKAYLSKVEAVEKGFLNFYLSNNFLQEQVSVILKSPESFLFPAPKKLGSARVEFISANPTGPLHIGNARGGPIGDVVANVLEKSGYKVLREYYNNNVGGQVKQLGSTLKDLLEGKDTSESQYQGNYILELSELLRDRAKDKSEEEVGKLAAEVLFEEIIKDSEAMGVKFDLIVHESDLQEKASQVVKSLKHSGVVKEKEGALWLAPKDEFLKDRETVLVKSDGSYTYFTDDIAYHQEKLESGADLIINVLGSNHSAHVPRIKAAVNALGFDTDKLKFILYQYVRVKRGNEVIKMSKRAGNFVTAREVLNEVGRDAFRFFLLLNKPETHMDFDLELAKKQADENPVYYVQYAHARMGSILSKLEIRDEVDLSLLKNSEELRLIRVLSKGPEIVEEVSQNFNVHTLVFYAQEIAREFHHFYEKVRVLSDNEENTQARLSLVKASQMTLKNILRLLGVSAPEKM